MQDIRFAVHAHPTVSKVYDEQFKSAEVSRTYTRRSKHHAKDAAQVFFFSILRDKTVG